MNQLLCRAKRKDNSEWIKGFYVKDALQHNSIIAEDAIQQPGCYPVAIDKVTLGQYREDLKAFDGDWIIAETNKGTSQKVEGFLDFQDLECVIEQNDGSFPVCSFTAIDRRSIRLTGKNIHDNPELITTEK